MTQTSLSDVWTLSLKSHKWSMSQAWMPYEVCGHSACAISETKIAIHTREGTLIYDDDLPTPSVLEQRTSGEGPEGLSWCASCGIPKAGADSDNTNHNQDMLIFGGSTKEKQGFSSEAFVLDTKSWKWTKLLPTSPTPRALQSPSMASLGNNNQCILFGGAALNQRDGTMEPTDETWLLTVNANEAHWEQVAVGEDQDTPSLLGIPTPEGRVGASLTATSSEELVLQGGYNPISKQTYGGSPGTAGGGGTWILTKHPIDHAKIAREKLERQKKIIDAQLTEAEAAASRVSDIIAQAGSGMGFDGTSLGVGGLDHVLEEVKTRIWTPLAAPPKLLKGESISSMPGNNGTCSLRQNERNSFDY